MERAGADRIALSAHPVHPVVRDRMFQLLFAVLLLRMLRKVAVLRICIIILYSIDVVNMFNPTIWFIRLKSKLKSAAIATLFHLLFAQWFVSI